MPQKKSCGPKWTRGPEATIIRIGFLMRRVPFCAASTEGCELPPSLISVQVGVPRIVLRDGEEVSTGIFKMPVRKRVQMRTFNLEGDRQADLSVHGGRDKAVYAYPSEHYAYWNRELAVTELPWGSFGENLTVAGFLEADVCLGDRFQIGTAEVVVTQPRLPCFKLNLKFQRDDMAKKFLASRRTGFYFRVLREGEVGAGDEIVLVHHDENRVSIADAMKIYLGDPDSDGLRESALRVEYLSKSWREEFSQLG
jgi:MOSC domain-containing protein YiiM